MILVVLAGTCVVASPAAAQFFGPLGTIPNPELVERTRHELGVGPILVSGHWHEDGMGPRTGSAGATGVSLEYGWRASRLWHLKMPVVIVPARRVAASVGDVPGDFTSLFATPGIRLRTRPGLRWAAWVGGGAGAARFVERATRLDGTSHPGPRSHVQAVGHIEVGLDLRLTTRVSAQWSLYGFWAKPGFLSERLGVEAYPVYMPVVLVTRF